MHTREQNLMRSSLMHRARSITHKQEVYIRELMVRRTFCATLRWISQNPLAHDDELETVRLSIHERLATQTPDFRRILAEMNALHVLQKEEKAKYRKSMRTPLFETAHQHGVSEREVRKIIIDVMRHVDHQPSQAEMARFMSHAISYWQQQGKLKEFVIKALKAQKGNLDKAGREMAMKSIKSVKSYGGLTRSRQMLETETGRIDNGRLAIYDRRSSWGGLQTPRRVPLRQDVVLDAHE